jgi:hypothetical protein
MRFFPDANNGDQWNLSITVRIWSCLVAVLVLVLVLAAIGLALAAWRQRLTASNRDIDVLDLPLLVSYDFAPDGRLLKTM